MDKLNVREVSAAIGAVTAQRPYTELINVRNHKYIIFIASELSRFRNEETAKGYPRAKEVYKEAYFFRHINLSILIESSLNSKTN